MAIEKPNYTQTPNSIYDLMPKMREAELRVTLAICRETFGWHRSDTPISISDLQRLTGLSRQGVITGLQAGMERGTITRTAQGPGFAYALNVAPDGEEPVNLVDTQPVNLVDTPSPEPEGSQLSRLPLVNLVDQQVVNLVDHKSKERSKERERKGERARSAAAPPVFPPPPGKPKSVIVYQNLAHFPPDVVSEQAILAAVGEDEPSLKRWGDAVTAWLLSGHRANNVRGMLDWYHDGIPTYTKENANGQSGRPAGRRPRPPAAAPVERPAYDPSLENEFN